MNLKELQSIVATCSLCELHEGRVKAVFDKGNENADIMICGMVPADEENKAGVPFVGRAGKLLDNILDDVNLNLSSVYITNIVKCYLAAGKSLQQSWIDACLPCLISQIYMIMPKVILTLGKDASLGLLGLSSNTSLSAIRREKIYTYGRDIVIIPTYHPSFLLRGGGTKHKNYKDVIEDFNLAKALAKKP